MRTDTQNIGPVTTGAVKKRGAKRKDFSFPTGEFTLASLREQFKLSIPLLKSRIVEAGALVTKIGVKNTGKRGKPPTIYQFLPNP